MSKTMYDQLTKPYQKDLLESLKKFVSINSVFDEKTANKKNPYGEGVTKALNFIAELANKDGFSVKNYDNRVVEITTGSGDKNLTIMAHADVVPAASGWDQDPFEVTEKKGLLCGRGVADDKGPLLASYYALKALRDNKKLGDYQVRFLVGGDEERGSSCMEHYFHTLKMPQPTFGFSPDSNFPIVFAEKGIVSFEIKKKINVKKFISLTGGVASNSVIEKADLVMEVDNDFLKIILDKFSRKEALIHTADDVTTVTFFGKAAHGATPELGINAGMIALETLADFSKDASLLKLVEALKPLDASGLNADAISKEMGHNTLNVGLISTNDGYLSIICNYRYVETVNSVDMMKNIKETLAGFQVKNLGEAKLLFFPKDSTLISTLYKAYQDETFDLINQPIAIGGGTYAKEADNVVAFGMEFNGFDSHMHSPGECVKKDDLFKAMSIYARSIFELGNKLK